MLIYQHMSLVPGLRIGKNWKLRKKGKEKEKNKKELVAVFGDLTLLEIHLRIWIENPEMPLDRLVEEHIGDVVWLSLSEPGSERKQ